MRSSPFSRLSRRGLLKGTAATGALGAIGSLPFGMAFGQSGQPLNFAAWAAAVDQVRAHLTAFEGETGVTVNYEQSPPANFRQTLVTKFVGGAPLDVLWVNDAWLPEFAEAGWIVPIDEYPNLMAYNAEVDQYCTESMTYNGRQYGLVYYADFMAFLYNADILEQAGIAAPPTTWDEVVEQSLIIKEKGLAEYPLLLSLEADAWLIEFVSTLVFAFGGRFVDAEGNAVVQDPEGGAVAAMKWVQAAIHDHKIVSPGAVSTQEIACLKAFGAGQHAFGVIPRYRIRPLNNPAESQVPGKVRMALMPKGGTGEHNTCGWVRFYGMTPEAKADPAKAENVVKFIEWFGGRSNGEYTFQKMLMLDIGVPFCTTPLDSDPDIIAFYNEYLGGTETVSRQGALAIKKDTVTPWFGEWNEINNQAWQKGFLRQVSAEDAMAETGREWDRLKRSY